MTAPIESIAAMTDQADADDVTPSADAEPRPPAQPLPEASLKPEAAALSAAPAASSVAAGARLRAARPVSPNAIIGLLGTLLVASLGAMTGLMMWQMSSLGDRIDRLDAKIDAVDNKIDTVHDKLVAKIDALDVKLDAKIDNKIDGLRAEMQAGFREVSGRANRWRRFQRISCLRLAPASNPQVRGPESMQMDTAFSQVSTYWRIL